MSKPNLYLSVASKGKTLQVGCTYGPFVHWQAIADWLDLNPCIRDDYNCVIHRATEGVLDMSIQRINERYMDKV